MNGRAVGDRQARSPECLAKLDIGAALRNTCASSWVWCVILARLPRQCCSPTVGGKCDLHIVRRGPCVVCRVVVASLSDTVRLVQVESTHLDHATSADLL